MPNPHSSAHAVGLSPSAQSEGQLIGILFQIRDEYVQAHNLVFGNPITRVLRFVRVLRAPRLSEVAAFMEVQLRMLDAASSGLTGLPLSRLRLNDAVEYFKSLRRAMSGLHVLLKESSARNVLPPASSATRKEYQIAAEEFGTLGDRLRTQPPRDSRNAPPASPDPSAGIGASAAKAYHKPAYPSPAADEADERQPIATSIDLAGRLFGVATVGMRDFAKPLLERSGVDGDVFRRLEWEGLCLRLFTGRTAFMRETEQEEQLQTEVLTVFDRLVALYFDDERRRTYGGRSQAYQQALAVGDDFEEILGRAYSRLCGWTGENAVAIGASQAIGMVVTAQEAVIDYRASNPLQSMLGEGQKRV
jgi:hypothetical protein